eukprot:Tbor_TRINITY_DN250_c0_g1::TRINITY_DN250_c0_g1_i1::g.12242::m.12242/K17616/CTDSPL2; CTD small phosphatase-like protein 2
MSDRDQLAFSDTSFYNRQLRHQYAAGSLYNSKGNDWRRYLNKSASTLPTDNSARSDPVSLSRRDMGDSRVPNAYGFLSSTRPSSVGVSTSRLRPTGSMKDIPVPQNNFYRLSSNGGVSTVTHEDRGLRGNVLRPPTDPVSSRPWVSSILGSARSNSASRVLPQTNYLSDSRGQSNMKIGTTTPYPVTGSSSPMYNGYRPMNYGGTARGSPSSSSEYPIKNGTTTSFMTQMGRYPQDYSNNLSQAIMIEGSNSGIVTGCNLIPSPQVPYKNRALLVLDLDETLVHASVNRSSDCDFSFVVNANGEQVWVYVKVRPFAQEFLKIVSGIFEICLFTASLSNYANRVIDYLDPTRVYIQHCLFREHCTYTSGSYVKDLSRLLAGGARDLDQICLLDNSPVTYALQPKNGFPIISWFDDPYDKELQRILPPLRYFAQCRSFRQTVERFRIHG